MILLNTVAGTLGDFLAQCTESGSFYKAPVQELYQSYCRYMTDLGYDPMHINPWGRELKLTDCRIKKRYHLFRGKKQWVYVGLRLR